MNLQSSFMRIAERSLLAAQAALLHTVQEKAGFLGYHSFESIGGAYCSAKGIAYHPASHPQKLHRFKNSCRCERFAKKVAQLSAELISLRSRLLYPRVVNAGLIQIPETVITPAQAKHLLGRIEALRKEVARVLK